MTKSKIAQWLLKNKIGLVLGFIVGAFIMPFLASLGLSSASFEALRPLLIGPMDFVGNLIPNARIGSHAYYVPIYKWIISLGFNGICYSVLGGVINSKIKRIKD